MKFQLRGWLDGIFVAALTLWGCSKNPDRLEEGSSSETVIGKVMLPDGNPAVGARVRLISPDYNPVVDGSLTESFIDTADADGTFSFHVGAGNVFNLEASDGSGQNRVLLRGTSPQALKPVDLGVVRLSSPGSVRISIPRQKVAQGDYVYIPGTLEYALVDSGMTSFSLDNIPENLIPEIRLVRPNVPGYSVLGDSVPVTSGKSFSLPSHFVLLVIPNRVPSAGEQAVADRLSGLGLITLMVQDSVFAPVDTVGIGLMMIPSSVHAEFSSDKFRDFTLPVHVSDPTVFPRMQMTGPTNAVDYGRVTNKTDLQIMLPSHPLAAGFSGMVTVSPTPVEFKWGNPPSGAVVIAVDPLAAQHALIFAFEKGALLYDGTAAPARRVGMFMHLIDTPQPNANSWKLFDASVRWAMGG